MAKQKQKWTLEEEEALSAGVCKYGHGKWKIILSDPQFAIPLSNRSNIDLKDKWRNMETSGITSSSREKLKTPRLEGVATSTRIISSPKPLSTVHLLEYGDTAEPSRSSVDRTDIDLIHKALCVGDQSGSDADTILNYAEVDNHSHKIADQSNNAEKPLSKKRAQTSNYSKRGVEKNTSNDFAMPTEKVSKAFVTPIVTEKVSETFATRSLSVNKLSKAFVTPSAMAKKKAPKALFPTIEVTRKDFATSPSMENVPKVLATPRALKKVPEASSTDTASKKKPEILSKELATKRVRKSSLNATPLAIEKAPTEASATPLGTKKAPPHSSTTPLATKSTLEISPKPFASKTIRKRRSSKRRARRIGSFARETLEDASSYAGYAVSVADNMELEAKEAWKKAERMAELLEESMVMLKAIEELYRDNMN